MRHVAAVARVKGLQQRQKHLGSASAFFVNLAGIGYSECSIPPSEYDDNERNLAFIENELKENDYPFVSSWPLRDFESFIPVLNQMISDAYWVGRFTSLLTWDIDTGMPVHVWAFEQNNTATEFSLRA